MTGREFGEGGWGPTGLGLSEHDFELLADYIGDALDDQAVRERVARRIAEDPVWHRAHAAVTEATALVSADLAAWGRSDAPMPTDVETRLMQALTDQGSVPGEPATSNRRLSVVRGEGPSAARPRRRPPRWAGPLAAAAAVLAVCGFGLRALPDLAGGHNDTASDSAASAPETFEGDAGAPAGGEDRALATPPVQEMTASGTAYTRESAEAAGRRAKIADGAGRSAQGGYQAYSQQPDQIEAAKAPSSLRRLTEPAALSMCLSTVGVAHAQPPATIELVDYATFEGSPALFIAYTDAAGSRWAWVAGPDCGLPGAGSDARYWAKVG